MSSGDHVKKPHITFLQYLVHLLHRSPRCKEHSFSNVNITTLLDSLLSDSNIQEDTESLRQVRINRYFKRRKPLNDFLQSQLDLNSGSAASLDILYRKDHNLLTAHKDDCFLVINKSYVDDSEIDSISCCPYPENSYRLSEVKESVKNQERVTDHSVYALHVHAGSDLLQRTRVSACAASDNIIYTNTSTMTDEKEFITRSTSSTSLFPDFPGLTGEALMEDDRDAEKISGVSIECKACMEEDRVAEIIPETSTECEACMEENRVAEIIPETSTECKLASSSRKKQTFPCLDSASFLNSCYKFNKEAVCNFATNMITAFRFQKIPNICMPQCPYNMRTCGQRTCPNYGYPAVPPLLAPRYGRRSLEETLRSQLKWTPKVKRHNCLVPFERRRAPYSRRDNGKFSYGRKHTRDSSIDKTERQRIQRERYRDDWKTQPEAEDKFKNHVQKPQQRGDIYSDEETQPKFKSPVQKRQQSDDMYSDMETQPKNMSSVQKRQQRGDMYSDEETQPKFKSPVQKRQQRGDMYSDVETQPQFKSLVQKRKQRDDMYSDVETHPIDESMARDKEDSSDNQTDGLKQNFMKVNEEDLEYNNSDWETDETKLGKINQSQLTSNAEKKNKSLPEKKDNATETKQLNLKDELQPNMQNFTEHSEDSNKQHEEVAVSSPKLKKNNKEPATTTPASTLADSTSTQPLTRGNLKVADTQQKVRVEEMRDKPTVGIDGDCDENCNFKLCARKKNNKEPATTTPASTLADSTSTQPLGLSRGDLKVADKQQKVRVKEMREKPTGCMCIDDYCNDNCNIKLCTRPCFRPDSTRADRNVNAFSMMTYNPPPLPLQTNGHSRRAKVKKLPSYGNSDTSGNTYSKAIQKENSGHRSTTMAQTSIQSAHSGSKSNTMAQTSIQSAHSARLPVVSHTRWAVTRINYFDCGARTYEVMESTDKCPFSRLEPHARTEVTFYISPNGSTAKLDKESTSRDNFHSSCFRKTQSVPSITPQNSFCQQTAVSIKDSCHQEQTDNNLLNNSGVIWENEFKESPRWENNQLRSTGRKDYCQNDVLMRTKDDNDVRISSYVMEKSQISVKGKSDTSCRTYNVSSSSSCIESSLCPPEYRQKECNFDFFVEKQRLRTEATMSAKDNVICNCSAGNNRRCGVARQCCEDPTRVAPPCLCCRQPNNLQ